MSASNSAIVLAKQVEAAWGVKPAVADMAVQRVSSASFALNRQELEDDSITESRGIPSVRYGNEDASGSISGNMAFTSWDDMIASAMMNVWVANTVQSDGIVEQSFTYEVGRTDIGVYEVWTGVQVNSFTVTSPTDGLTTVSFDCLAKTQAEINAVPLDLTLTPDAGTEAMFHCGGVINYKGVPLAIITSIDVTLDNGLESQFGWGDCAAQDLTFGKSRVSGTMSALMVDDTFQQDSLAETDVSIDFTLTDPDGNSVTFDMPVCKLGSVDAPIESEGATVLTIPFRGQGTEAIPTMSVTRS